MNWRTIGVAAIVPENVELCLGQRMMMFRPASYVTSNYFLCSLMSPVFRNQVKPKIIGTTSPHVNIRDLKEMVIPIPPLNEQKRIVAKIEELNDRHQRAKQALEAIPELCDRFRQSVLSAAFRGDLTADWREENGVDDEWVTSTLATVVQSLNQGWSPKCDNTPSPSTNVWGVIKTTAVQAMSFLEEENKCLPDTLSPRPELEIQVGDLLITRAGPRVRAGVCCLVRSVRPRLMICDKVYRFRLDERLAELEFMELLLNTPEMVDKIDELKTGISDSGVNLTQQKFLDLEFLLPSIVEQKEIVRRIRNFFNHIKCIDQNFRTQQIKLDRLNQSILAKAFRGELVEQDPNDEPASVLLDRIRAEREKLQGNKKSGSARGKRKKATENQLDLPGVN
ncbi:MAG TPA: restriction endonuclease subunit S [Allocoleopsis sp.]